MSDILRYKKYTGHFDYDNDAEFFHGEVMDIDDVVTFQGKSVAELKSAFQESVEEYLAVCKKIGKSPEKPYSGKFTIRVSPDIHREVSIAARSSGKSINEYIRDLLQKTISTA